MKKIILVLALMMSAVTVWAADSCPVCLEDLGGSVAALNCAHRFHAACIRQWVNQSPTCPTCRAPIHVLPVIDTNLPLRNVITAAAWLATLAWFVCGARKLYYENEREERERHYEKGEDATKPRLWLVYKILACMIGGTLGGAVPTSLSKIMHEMHCDSCEVHRLRVEEEGNVNGRTVFNEQESIVNWWYRAKKIHAMWGHTLICLGMGVFGGWVAEAYLPPAYA